MSTLRRYNAEGKLKPKKKSLYENGDNVDLKSLQDRDKNKVVLQITKSLAILVDPENNTSEFAEEYRKKIH